MLTSTPLISQLISNQIKIFFCNLAYFGTISRSFFFVQEFTEKSSLESHKLELLTEISQLHLKHSVLERENLELREALHTVKEVHAPIKSTARSVAAVSIIHCMEYRRSMEYIRSMELRETLLLSWQLHLHNPTNFLTWLMAGIGLSPKSRVLNDVLFPGAVCDSHFQGIFCNCGTYQLLHRRDGLGDKWWQYLDLSWDLRGLW